MKVELDPELVYYILIEATNWIDFEEFKAVDLEAFALSCNNIVGRVEDKHYNNVIYPEFETVYAEEMVK